MDGIAGLKATSSQTGISVQREIENRENADCIESPGRDALHGPPEGHGALLEGYLRKRQTDPGHFVPCAASARWTLRVYRGGPTIGLTIRRFLWHMVFAV